MQTNYSLEELLGGIELSDDIIRELSQYVPMSIGEVLEDLIKYVSNRVQSDTPSNIELVELENGHYQIRTYRSGLNLNEATDSDKQAYIAVGQPYERSAIQEQFGSDVPLITISDFEHTLHPESCVGNALHFYTKDNRPIVMAVQGNPDSEEYALCVEKLRNIQKVFRDNELLYEGYPYNYISEYLTSEDLEEPYIWDGDRVGTIPDHLHMIIIAATFPRQLRFGFLINILDSILYEG